VALRDEQGRVHPVMADVGCRNTVFGSQAQEASRHLDLWRQAGIRHYRLEFVHESGGEVREVAEVFSLALAGRLSATELARRLHRIAPQGTTEGSLFVAGNYLELPLMQ
jgi:putative protease